MQVTIDIGYDQVFELVRQLPPEGKERLFWEIEPKRRVDQNRQEALRLALECPVATPEDIGNQNEFGQNEFRKQFRCRPT